MKFSITIDSSSQPGLIALIEKAKDRLLEGGTHLHTSTFEGNVKLTPDSPADEEQFRNQYDLAHPTPQAKWVDKSICKIQTV